MPRLTIDGRETEVPAGATILTGARRLGIEIPTLCFADGYEHFTSCMVCVVREKRSGKLLPACSARAAEGMTIETDGPEIRQARKDTLDLLLSEHVGDCEGPCRVFCPAYMDIPLMIRQIAAGAMAEAAATVRRHIPFPSVLGRICPAPCEKGCHRAKADAGLAICLLKRHVGDAYLAAQPLRLPAAKPATGRKVAIVGAGPAGMTAAYYLLLEGHRCALFDDREAPGGMLRHGVPAERLPRDVLDAEIEVVRRLGAEFRMKTAVGKAVSLEELKADYDAVVIAAGPIGAAGAGAFSLQAERQGIKIDPATFRTSDARVFAGGSAVQPSKLAVRAVAHGRGIACSVDQLLRGLPVAGPPKPFNSRVGSFYEGEVGALLAGADAAARVAPAAGGEGSFSPAEALKETARCMHCDCRKPLSCKLRQYAQDYGASQQRYGQADRVRVERLSEHLEVLAEPGKCIKCGLCVQATQKGGEPLGLTFVSRGFDVRVGVPLGRPLSEGLTRTAAECVRLCPTAALAFREKEEKAPAKTAPESRPG
jgi:ferredoxin